MKQIIKFFSRHFGKQKTFSSLFSEAVSEGIRETFKEMGYQIETNDDLEIPCKKESTESFFEHDPIIGPKNLDFIDHHN